MIDRVLGDIDADLDNALARLFDWLRFPSISTDPAYASDCRRAAEWVRGELESLGFQARLGETSFHPVVLAHRPNPGAPHVLFYGHYDVQPVDPLELWDSPPFEPRLTETEPGRKVIAARGACDDKGQVMTFLEACRAWQATEGGLPVGLTILIEGAEESGSRGLPEWLAANKSELRADCALVCDTGMWDRNVPAITTSLRGLVYREVVVRAANRDLHSGSFGGAARNPIHVLARILADLHDESGRVTLPGFYDGVPETPPEILEQWRSLDLTPDSFLGPIGLGVPAGERDRMVIEQIQSRPTCDANGIVGGYTGEGNKTVIAGEARMKLSFRLVGQQNPQAIGRAFEAFVRERVPSDCRVEILGEGGSSAIQLPYGMPALAKARDALAAEWGESPVLIGAGGSIPIVGDFKRTLGLDTLLVGFGLEDDRVHSPNEKYDLTSFRKGARSWARILDALGRA